MDETYVKQNTRDNLLKHCGVATYRFEDRFLSHIPDMLIACAGKCAFIEVKFAKDPYLPHTWKAYRAGQSENLRRLQFNTGIPCYYYCRNEIGQFSISKVESVVARHSSKTSLTHKECIHGELKGYLALATLLKEGFPL